MKVIQVVGRSNSGKTYFIHRLLERMTLLYPGEVGVIKHLGHHVFDLAEGKDTTTHFEHGAECVAGIDAEKTVLTARGTDLDRALGILCDMGMRFVIIEGFKDFGFKRIVKGELESGGCLFRDPCVDEVLESLELFDDYYTAGGVVHELEKDTRVPPGACILAFSSSPETARKESTVIQRIETEMMAVEGVFASLIRRSTSNDRIFAAVAASGGKAACAAIHIAAEEIDY